MERMVVLLVRVCQRAHLYLRALFFFLQMCDTFSSPASRFCVNEGGSRVEMAEMQR